ncbi:MAG TPA: hypothetical protein VM619_03380 [Luteimonas sp.]|nr:hypothetical protein [Luteimonas sp.]
MPMSPAVPLLPRVIKGACGVILAFAATGFPVALPAQDARADKARSQWQREDIAVFRDAFMARDISFAPQARRVAMRRLAKLEHDAPDPDTFAVELCRIAALADNAHTQCLPNGAGRDICQGVSALGFSRRPWCQPGAPDHQIPDFNTVPIAFFPFGKDFNVVGVEENDSDLLGARLVAVEGRPVADILAILRTFAGGIVAHRDERAAAVLASPAQLHAVGLCRDSGAVRYRFVTLQGRQVDRTFTVRPPGAKVPTWRGLPDVEQASWAFQEPARAFRYRDAPELDAVVVQLRKTFDDGDRKIADFLEDVEAKRREVGRKHVVLDMRFNGGGNFLLVRDFMARWPARMPGRFFVLTSRQTFSAAIAAIAYLKQAGKDRVTIVGEPVGDRMMFFSDGLPIRLPHSGRYFLPAVVRMDYRDGCKAYDDCQEAISQPGRPVVAAALPMLGPVARLPISVPTLAPDVAVPWTIDAWREGKDPIMDAVAARLGKPAG